MGKIFGCPQQSAQDIGIADLGNYYAGITVEAALQELGSGGLDLRYLKLDQTTPQDISGGQPDFLAGLRAGSMNQLSIDASGNLITSGTLGAGATTVTSLDAGVGNIQTTGNLISGTIYTTIPTTGLKTWLKADAIVGLTDGQTVTTWTDSSGLGNNGTGVGTPTYETNEINGKPVVRFNGSNAYFTLPNVFSAMTAGEVFIVIKSVNDISNCGFWLFGTSGSNSHYTWGGTIFDDFGRNARVTVGDPTAFNLSSFHTYNVISTATEWTANMDLTQLYTTGTNTVAFTTTPRLGLSTSSYLVADIAEIIIYSAKLSTADRNQVNSYLQYKYQLFYNSNVSLVTPTGISAGGNLSSTAIVYGSHLKDLSLTSGRIVFTTTGGQLADSLKLTFDSVTPRLTTYYAFNVLDTNGNSNFQIAAYPTAADTIIAGAEGSTAGKVYISTGASYYKGIVLTYLDANTTRIGMGGITSPTAILNIGAGTATSGTAPLKFTSGTLLTTPEAGTIEYLSGTFYIRGTDNLSSTNYLGNSLALIKSVGTTGNLNILIGETGNTVISGDNNFLAGTNAGQAITTSDDNIAIGEEALKNQTTGGVNLGKNLALGYRAGKSYTGDNGFFIGAYAGEFTTGIGNFMFGNVAGWLNTTGVANTCLGNYAGYALGAGNDHNIFIGYSVGGTSAVGAVNNVVIGNYAGASIGAGLSNVIIGYSAGTATTKGYNVIVGANAGTHANTQFANTIIGYGAGTSLANPVDYYGGSNTFIGYASGVSTTTGVNNVYLGATSGYYQTTASSQLLIDGIIRVSASNELTQSLIYGTFNTVVANQQLTINAGTLNFNSGTIALGTVATIANGYLNINGTGAFLYLGELNEWYIRPYGSGELVIGGGSMVTLPSLKVNDLGAGGIVITSAGVMSLITDNHTNWDTAYGWGNWSGANISSFNNDSGYITSGYSHFSDYNNPHATTISQAESAESITPAGDGTYNNPTSITISKGIITAIS